MLALNLLLHTKQSNLIKLCRDQVRCVSRMFARTPTPMCHPKRVKRVEPEGRHNVSGSNKRVSTTPSLPIEGKVAGECLTDEGNKVCTNNSATLTVANQRFSKRLLKCEKIVMCCVTTRFARTLFAKLIKFFASFFSKKRPSSQN